MDEPTNPQVNIKIDDDELRGRYANLVRITHTREEFILDFVNMVPPQGTVTARVITSPGHAKRLMRALESNLQHYEQAFGKIVEAPEGPDKPPVN